MFPEHREERSDTVILRNCVHVCVCICIAGAHEGQGHWISLELEFKVIVNPYGF